MARRAFEDIDLGEQHESRRLNVTKAEIIAFAEEFDPQPFHVDEEAAKESVFGELVASGFHILSICSKLTTEAFLSDIRMVGGRSFGDIEIYAAVRPDDELYVRVEVVEKFLPESHPKYGHLEVHVTGMNQNDDTVAKLGLQPIVGRRDR